MMGKNIQHTKSRIRRRSSNANACGSRKEEDEDEDEKKTFGYCFSPCYFEVKEWFWNWKTQHNAKKYFEDLPIMYPKKNVEVNHLEIFLLPDDILEMCLNRLPLTSLKKLNIKIYGCLSLVLCNILVILVLTRYMHLIYLAMNGML
jgi:hypothetical protein